MSITKRIGELVTRNKVNLLQDLDDLGYIVAFTDNGGILVCDPDTSEAVEITYRVESVQ